MTAPRTILTTLILLSVTIAGSARPAHAEPTPVASPQQFGDLPDELESMYLRSFLAGSFSSTAPLAVIFWLFVFDDDIVAEQHFPTIADGFQEYTAADPDDPTIFKPASAPDVGDESQGYVGEAESGVAYLFIARNNNLVLLSVSFALPMAEEQLSSLADLSDECFARKTGRHGSTPEAGDGTTSGSYWEHLPRLNDMSTGMTVEAETYWERQ